MRSFCFLSAWSASLCCVTSSTRWFLFFSMLALSCAAWRSFSSSAYCLLAIPSSLFSFSFLRLLASCSIISFLRCISEACCRSFSLSCSLFIACSTSTCVCICLSFNLGSNTVTSFLWPLLCAMSLSLSFRLASMLSILALRSTPFPVPSAAPFSSSSLLSLTLSTSAAPSRAILRAPGAVGMKAGLGFSCVNVAINLSLCVISSSAFCISSFRRSLSSASSCSRLRRSSSLSF
mmetsp:Transcript_223/g.595  ORF Transcript_223/g.595 Transcript_223/m.595 type:complete len:234 (-) Transcript_223:137-838(-)